MAIYLAPGLGWIVEGVTARTYLVPGIGWVRQPGLPLIPPPPIEQPRRAARGLGAHLLPPSGFVPVGIAAPVVVQLGWLQPLSAPDRFTRPPIASDHLAFVPDLSPVVIRLDWLQPLSAPLRPAPRGVTSGAAAFMPELMPGALAWLQPLASPQPAPRGASHAAWEFVGAPTLDLSWLMELASPVRAASRLPVWAASEFVVAPLPGISWLAPFAIPVWTRPAIPSGPFSAIVVIQPPAPVPSIGWLAPLSIPPTRLILPVALATSGFIYAWTVPPYYYPGVIPVSFRSVFRIVRLSALPRIAAIKTAPRVIGINAFSRTAAIRSASRISKAKAVKMSGSTFVPPPERLPAARAGDIDTRGSDYTLVIGPSSVSDPITTIVSVTVARRDGVALIAGDLSITPAGRAPPWITTVENGAVTATGYIVNWWQTSGSTIAALASVDYKITVSATTAGGRLVIHDHYQMVVSALG